MSTVSLSRPAAGIALTARRTARAPVLLALGLLALILYAAFAHGAASEAAGARIQVVVAAIGALAAGAGMWRRTLRFAAPAQAIAGIALLVGFAVWSGVTIIWSVAPDQTWVECNRALTYCVVLCLAVMVGASDRRAPELIAMGFTVVAFAVAGYALAQKLLPGLHIAGIFDLNQTGLFPRLQEPLGYWNALALFVVLGVPGALALAADRERRAAVRLTALAALEVMVLAIAFTYSRGGLIALAVGCVIAVAASGARLRMLMWLAVAGVAAAPALGFGLTRHDLTTAGVSLSSRESTGTVLLLVLLVSLAGLTAWARQLHALEARDPIGPDDARRIARVLRVVAAVVVVGAVLAVAASPRGLTGTVSHAVHSFTSTRSTSNYDPARLLSADSENRWVWWKEAAGAFSDRPVAGWGAGSFGVVHLLYRRDTLSVTQPHSVPLQFLAETGVIGTALGLLGFVLLFAAAARSARRSQTRGLAVALLAGAAAYAVHALYDWDWDIPAVTLPALLFLGVLAGAAPRTSRRERVIERRPGPARALALAALTAGLTVLAVSGVLPSAAASTADSAVLSAASNSPSGLRTAQSQARLATNLDPFADGGLRLQATLAVRRNKPRLAHSLLLAAIDRDPSDTGAWAQLVFVELSLGRTADAVRAADRLLALDPERPGDADFARAVLHQATLPAAPPQASATAGPLGRP